MPAAIILGGGMVGSIMAADLATDDAFEITVADVNESALEAIRATHGDRIATVQADLSDAAVIGRTVEPFDIVLGALSSHLGFAALQAVIEAGKHYCDISFMPEDALLLDEAARERGVTAVVDCGVAPGMSNLLAGWGVARMEACSAIHIYVGGVPERPQPPYHYKAAFSPSDVIEEYTRPARVVADGRMVEREALSEVEQLDFPGVGTLEAFNTDGLRSLADTLPVPLMIEKTMRYPGHADLMRVFRETGLFDTEPIEVNGVSIVPRDVIKTLMFPHWTYEPGEADLTALRVVVEGTSDGRRQRLHWDMLDRYDHERGHTSMARTTAFPCTIVARKIADGTIQRAGVVPPELLAGEEGLVEHVLKELAARDVRYVEGS